MQPVFGSKATGSERPSTAGPPLGASSWATRCDQGERINQAVERERERVCVCVSVCATSTKHEWKECRCGLYKEGPLDGNLIYAPPLPIWLDRTWPLATRPRRRGAITRNGRLTNYREVLSLLLRFGLAVGGAQEGPRRSRRLVFMVVLGPLEQFSSVLSRRIDGPGRSLKFHGVFCVPCPWPRWAI